MKVCPQCQKQYRDRSLNFCLEDGAELIGAVERLDLTTDTYEETETVIISKSPSQVSFDLSNNSQEQEQNESQITQIRTEEPTPKKSRSLIKVLLTVFTVLVILLGVVGIGAYFYLNQGKYVFGDNREQTKEDVKKAIFSWKAKGDLRMLSSYMSNYSSEVDYYNEKGASKDFVYKDKEKSFKKYKKIKSTFSDLEVKPSLDGKSAVATFDKEWEFSGKDSQTNGKVRSQLKLKKLGDKWLITSEKDLKVYYVNK